MNLDPHFELIKDLTAKHNSLVNEHEGLISSAKRLDNDIKAALESLCDAWNAAVKEIKTYTGEAKMDYYKDAQNDKNTND